MSNVNLKTPIAGFVVGEDNRVWIIDADGERVDYVTCHDQVIGAVNNYPLEVDGYREALKAMIETNKQLEESLLELVKECAKRTVKSDRAHIELQSGAVRHAMTVLGIKEV